MVARARPRSRRWPSARPCRLSSNLEESISLLPTLFAAVQFGPLEAMIVAAGSMLWDLRPAHDQEEPYKKWAVYTSSRSLIACGHRSLLASLYHGRRRSPGHRYGHIRRRICALRTVARCRFRIPDTSRFAAASRIAIPKDDGPAVSRHFRSTPLVVVLGSSDTSITRWTSVAVLRAGTRSAKNSSLSTRISEMLAEGLEAPTDSLERANLSFATALVTTLDARDRYTAGHSAAVAIYSRDIATRLGLSETEQQESISQALSTTSARLGCPRLAREGRTVNSGRAPRHADALRDRRANSRQGR